MKKWKTEVEREKQAAGGKSGAKPPGACSPAAHISIYSACDTLAAKKAASASSAVTPSTPATPTTSGGGGKFSSDSRSAKSDGVKIDYSGDKTRDKCAELIYDALVFDSAACKLLAAAPPEILQAHTIL